MKNKAKFLLLVVLPDVSEDSVNKADRSSKRTRDAEHKKKKEDRTAK